MEALDSETSRAEGEPALQALLTFVRAHAGQLAAHDAEPGLCKRLRPMGLAALLRSCAQRGPGEVGPAVPRADGVLLPREQQRRGRASFAILGQCQVARPCDRAPAAPGLCPRYAPVNLPERCDSSFRRAWMTVCEGAYPCQERAGVVAPRFELEGAERGWRAVAPEAPQDAQACEAPRPLSPADTVGARLGGRFAGQGVPRRQEEAAQLKAKWGTGEKRPQRGRHAWSRQTRRGCGGRGTGSRTSRPAPRRGGGWPAWGGRRRR
jgi:hypothetical protein